MRSAAGVAAAWGAAGRASAGRERRARWREKIAQISGPSATQLQGAAGSRGGRLSAKID